MGIEEKRLALKRARLEAARNARPEPQYESMPEGESALRGAAQGALLGFPDEIAGAFEAGKDVVLGDKTLGDFGDQYTKHRDESRAIYDKAQKDNPASYIAGDVAGSIGSAFIPGLGFANAAKGATLAAKLGRAGLAGAAMGLGSNRVDLTKGRDLTPDEVKDVGTDVLLGGALGAAGEGAGQAIGKAASKVGQKATSFLDDFADWNTLKAAGAMTKDRKALRHQGISKDVADYLRRKGVVKFGSTIDDALERSKSLESQAGEKVSDSLMQLDDLASRGQGIEPVAMEMSAQPMTASVNSVADEVVAPIAGGNMTRLPPPKTTAVDLPAIGKQIQSEVIQPLKDGPLESKRIAKKLEAELDDLLARGDEMSFVDANKLKRKYDDLIKNYGKEMSPYIENLKKFRGVLNKGMEDSADRVAAESGNEALSAGWKEAKKDTRFAKTVSEMAANRSDQIKTNNPFGLTDYITGASAIGGGLASDDPSKALYAAPLIVANQLARKRGPAALGVGSKALSNFIKSPPDGLAKFAKVLSNAAKRGNNSLAATHLFLMQNEPDYAKAMEGNE